MVVLVSPITEVKTIWNAGDIMRGTNSYDKLQSCWRVTREGPLSSSGPGGMWGPPSEESRQRYVGKRDV